MILWIAIILIVVVGYIYIKIDHNARLLKSVILLILAFLLIFSVISIFSSNDVDLSSPKGILDGLYLYVGWVGNSFAKLWDVGAETVTGVGHAIKVNNNESFDDLIKQR